MLALVLADLEDRHDPRVVELGGSLGLGVEPFDLVLIGKWPAKIILRATVRLRLIWRAWNTTPIPPRAISRSIS